MEGGEGLGVVVGCKCVKVGGWLWAMNVCRWVDGGGGGCGGGGAGKSSR